MEEGIARDYTGIRGWRLPRQEWLEAGSMRKALSPSGDVHLQNRHNGLAVTGEEEQVSSRQSSEPPKPETHANERGGGR